MPRINKISYALVDFIPERIEDGVLYISKRFGTATHKCCCGCGEEVVTPLTPTDWTIKIEQELVSLKPSIGNWSYRCRSHYWISRGKVNWAHQMTDQEIDYGRKADRRMKKLYFDEINKRKVEQLEPKVGIFRFLAKIKRWFKNI